MNEDNPPLTRPFRTGFRTDGAATPIEARGRVLGQGPGTPGRPVRPLNGSTRSAHPDRAGAQRQGIESLTGSRTLPGLRYWASAPIPPPNREEGALAIEVPPSRESAN